MKFIRDAIALGVDVTVVIERSWEKRLDEYLGPRMPRLIRPPYVFSKSITGMIGALMARSERADTLLIGAPDEAVSVSVGMLLRAGVAKRVVVSAEGEAGPEQARAFAGHRMTIVANSNYIADTWRGRFTGDLHVSYGLADSHQFHPPASPQRKSTVDFVLLAKLPSEAKGADIAIEAFARLPDAVRSRCRLHLAGYVDPPPSPAPGVVTHKWLSSEAVGAFLRTMDVQLVPSRWESFCQAAVQGMLTGLPLITSRISVLTEKVDTGGGITCSTVDEYASAMERLALDEGLRLRMGQAGRATALDRYVYDPTAYLERYFFPGRTFRADASAVHGESEQRAVVGSGSIG